MSEAPHDPRALANILLNEADHQKIDITNIALQKLLYFCHGIYLMKTGTSLISGYFEAWQYGPVHPVVDRSFRSAGSDPIRFRAKRRDISTGVEHEIPEPSDADVHRLIRQILSSYGQMSAGRLVEVSHARGAPWDVIVEKSKRDIAFGLRIPDDVILEHFRKHKVPLGTEPKMGEPTDDAPFA